MAALPEGWSFAGLWTDDEYHEGRDFDNDEIAAADAIIVEWNGPNEEHEFVTFHGADDIDRVVDLIEDIDTDSYFG
jgi:hypothetical protein